MISIESTSVSPVWRPAPLHPREDERLAVLRGLQLLGTDPEPAYDRLCQLAQAFLQAPVVLIALVDERYSFFKACVGADLPGIPKDDGPCGYTILRKDALVIPDMAADPTFAACPVVKNLGVRFYAGVPLFEEDGLPLGTLCVLGQTPRDPDPAWVASLTALAAVVQDELALTRSHLRIGSAYKELKSSEEQYMSLVSTVPGVVYRLERGADEETRFTFMSEGIRDFCGREAGEFRELGQALETVLHPEDAPDLLAQFERSRHTFEPFLWQGRMQSRWGGLRWIQTTARPEMTEDGRMKWAGIITDIGTLKAAEAEIREMNRTLEDKVDARTRELHDAQIEMLGRLGLAAEARDDDTGAHVVRVAAVSGILAREIGMTEAECEMVRQATPMHDIGKIGVPDAILLKPGRLDEDEFLAMRCHAIQGSKMLQGGKTALVQMAETIARTHHERWDGTGYPSGLKAEAIPLVGRIVAVADVFDALTAERPYKRAWRVDEAVREIASLAGSHFDPAVVDAFLRTLPEILSAVGKGELARAA